MMIYLRFILIFCLLMLLPGKLPCLEVSGADAKIYLPNFLNKTTSTSTTPITSTTSPTTVTTTENSTAIATEPDEGTTSTSTATKSEVPTTTTQTPPTTTTTTTEVTREIATTVTINNYNDLYDGTKYTLDEISSTLLLLYEVVSLSLELPVQTFRQSPLRFLRQQQNVKTAFNKNEKRGKTKPQVNGIMGINVICKKVSVDCPILLSTLNSIDKISNEIVGGIYTSRNLNLLNQDQLDLQYETEVYNSLIYNIEQLQSYITLVQHSVNSSITATDSRIANINNNQKSSKVFIGTFSFFVGLAGLTMIVVAVYAVYANYNLSKKEKLEKKIHDIKVIEDGGMHEGNLLQPPPPPNSQQTTELYPSTSRSQYPETGSRLLRSTNSRMEVSNPSTSHVKSDNYY